jgi:hypothetical protein
MKKKFAIMNTKFSPFLHSVELPSCFRKKKFQSLFPILNRHSFRETINLEIIIHVTYLLSRISRGCADTHAVLGVHVIQVTHRVTGKLKYKEK